MTTRRFSTSFKPRKKTHSPKCIPAVDGWITQSEAIALIAEHCNPPHESSRAFKNKVAGTINYAVGANQLVEMDGGFIFGELMAWAKNKPKWAYGLAPFPAMYVGRLDGSVPSITGAFRAISLPPSLEASHQALLEADRTIQQLEARLNAAEQEINYLRPFAETGLRMKRPKRRW